MFDLENECQGHGVQHSQWFHSIAISIKVILEHSSIALTLFEIFIFKNSWPWKCRSRLWCITLAFEGKYLTSHMMVIIMFALSLTIYEIFANQEICKHFTSELKGKVKEYKRPTCTIRLEVFGFIFRIVLSGNMRLRKRTPIHAHTFSERQGWWL